MLMVAGATAVKFVGESMTVIVTGWLFVGVVVVAFGSWRFSTMQQDINGGTAATPLQTSVDAGRS